jgi:hypothetical protein
MAADNMRTGGEKSSEVQTKQSQENEEIIEGEASQFHSQDNRGRALFGYMTPDQARIEARSEDGTVRGSYSYLDAWGKAVKVKPCPYRLKVKINLSLCLTKHCAMKTYWGVEV